MAGAPGQAIGEALVEVLGQDFHEEPVREGPAIELDARRSVGEARQEGGAVDGVDEGLAGVAFGEGRVAQVDRGRVERVGHVGLHHDVADPLELAPVQGARVREHVDLALEEFPYPLLRSRDPPQHDPRRRGFPPPRLGVGVEDDLVRAARLESEGAGSHGRGGEGLPFRASAVRGHGLAAEFAGDDLEGEDVPGTEFGDGLAEAHEDAARALGLDGGNEAEEVVAPRRGVGRVGIGGEGGDDVGRVEGPPVVPARPSKRYVIEGPVRLVLRDARGEAQDGARGARVVSRDVDHPVEQELAGVLLRGARGSHGIEAGRELPGGHDDPPRARRGACHGAGRDARRQADEE